jgi:hypothetical protein
VGVSVDATQNTTRKPDPSVCLVALLPMPFPLSSEFDNDQRHCL